MEAPDERRVHVGHACREDVGAGHRAYASGEREILDRIRDAVQRAEGATTHDRGFRVSRARQRGVGRERAERVQRRVHALDAFEDGASQLDR